MKNSETTEILNLPNCITNNLKADFDIRPYQKEAFFRFIDYYSKYKEANKKQPIHLLYNMATGSGKTLVMAGLILYLYEKGYRNFLFFVHSNNIINKTKVNFLNFNAAKYLFRSALNIDGKRVNIKETNSFEHIDKDNINIKFTTIQQLHFDLNHVKENSITYQDFVQNKIVMIADEAHHLSTSTKKNNDGENTWEQTVLKIWRQHTQNILLEFTATLDFKNADIVSKYKNKILFKYDLSQFRKDKYSKEINILTSTLNETNRILQAVILNIYRQELAQYNQIFLKPVILFKAKKTIAASEKNKENFHLFIENLTTKQLEFFKKESKDKTIQKAFDFFEKNKISTMDILQKIKYHFKYENCLSANNDLESEKNQILLNSLEDQNNKIRAVFAVQKLNEGWDVLNLFDIVRLYENIVLKKISKKADATTLSEAQLIGRGARYFPFITAIHPQKYLRKFDDEPNNDLKILEELYYHTIEDNQYIKELKNVLAESGIYQEHKIQSEHKKLNKNKKVFLKKKKIHSISDLKISKQAVEVYFERNIDEISTSSILHKKTIKILNIPIHIVKYALSRNSFFYFNNLKLLFPKLHSMSTFINDKSFLANLQCTFICSSDVLKEISNEEYLLAMTKILDQLELEIKN